MMMASLWKHVSSYLSPPSAPGESEETPLDVYAVPGLMTLLDHALFRTVEGELTATLSASHMLLAAWLDFKQQAIVTLREVKQEPDSVATTSRRAMLERFARACLDVACDAIERFTTERLAQTANLTDPFESLLSSSQHSVYSSQSNHHLHPSSSSSWSVDDSSQDTARRRPLPQRPRDVWESPRLLCPDYIWADDAVQHFTRLLRHLYKHAFVVEYYSNDAASNHHNTVMYPTSSSMPSNASSGHLSRSTERQTALLMQLLDTDIPTLLLQFKTAMEADAMVTKRLYLVKCEYRAPFRAFLEAHQSVLRAPCLEMIDQALSKKATTATAATNTTTSSSKAATNPNKRRSEPKYELQQLLENPDFIQALSLEQKCAEYETEMAKALYGFCELARFLEQKNARLKPVQGIVSKSQLVPLQETLRRLRNILCRKAGPETSTGIRPLLLDLQGVARDDEPTTTDETDPDIHQARMTERLERLIQDLETLARLCEARNAFASGERRDVDLPSSIVRGCTNQWDSELFRCYGLDWYSMVQQQHVLTQHTDFEDFAERLRRAEMQVSLAVAPTGSLEVVRERVERIAMDRTKRLEILQEMITEICWREMNLHVRLHPPEENKPLTLPTTSTYGVFGIPLLMAGEALPIG